MRVAHLFTKSVERKKMRVHVEFGEGHIITSYQGRQESYLLFDIEGNPHEDSQKELLGLHFWEKVTGLVVIGYNKEEKEAEAFFLCFVKHIIPRLVSLKHLGGEIDLLEGHLDFEKIESVSIDLEDSDAVVLCISRCCKKLKRIGMLYLSDLILQLISENRDTLSYLSIALKRRNSTPEQICQTKALISSLAHLKTLYICAADIGEDFSCLPYVRELKMVSWKKHDNNGKETFDAFLQKNYALRILRLSGCDYELNDFNDTNIYVESGESRYSIRYYVEHTTPNKLAASEYLTCLCLGRYKSQANGLLASMRDLFPMIGLFMYQIRKEEKEVQTKRINTN